MVDAFAYALSKFPKLAPMRAGALPAESSARIAATAGNFDAAFASAPIKLSQSYKYHYQGSMPIGPCCAVADVTPSGARIFTNSQSIYLTRGSVPRIHI